MLSPVEHEKSFLASGLVLSSLQIAVVTSQTIFEPRCEKTGIRGFRTGLIQTRL